MGIFVCSGIFNRKFECFPSMGFLMYRFQYEKDTSLILRQKPGIQKIVNKAHCLSVY